MKTPTITEIKVATRATNPHFFDRSTLRFFGQRMRDFCVRQSPSGRVFIYAPRCDGARLMGYTFREFVNGDLVLPRDGDGALADHDTLADVLEYIEAH